MTKGDRVKPFPQAFFDAILGNDSVTMTRFLTDGNYDVNAGRGFGVKHGTALCETVAGRKCSMVLELIAHGATVNKPGNAWGESPLHIATRNGDIKMVELLVDSGGELDISDRGGATPLTIACETGNEKLVKYLLEHGADINHRTGFEIIPPEIRKQISNSLISETQRENMIDGYKQNTPLTKAVWANKANIVRELLKRGCDVAIQNSGGNTALHIAARDGHVDIVETLIEHHWSFMDTRDSNGETPVLLAGRSVFETPSITGSWNHLQIVNLLLQAGCDVDAKNNAGKRLIFLILTTDFADSSSPDAEEMRMRLLQGILSASGPIRLEDLPENNQISPQLSSLGKDMFAWLVNLSKSPRSLKHTCRITLRNILLPKLSAKVEELSIPGCLKLYLRLQTPSE